ncbi:hypothetical protein JCM6292_3041 [Bacteroides pyogenes JCM 6292]|uniref:Uncharacterized protein n=1 Tax=Bacteroides pyogenes JCM 6292 TaxID=1235809 RepID=W4PB15_9BACE|nr:hypothetical protein JCM6292_3041 [Bacteroides pyogenes JCM 6292]
MLRFETFAGALLKGESLFRKERIIFYQNANRCLSKGKSLLAESTHRIVTEATLRQQESASCTVKHGDGLLTTAIKTASISQQ